MGRKRKEPTAIRALVTCRYCFHFNISKTIFRTGDKDNTGVKVKYALKHCNILSDLVDRHSEICTEFEPAEDFYCRISEIRMTIPMCAKRRTNSYLWPECGKCSQIRELLELRRMLHRKTVAAAATPSPETPLKRKELPMRHEEPKLIRREL